MKIGFKMPTHIYLLCRMGLGEEHMQEVVQRLGLKVRASAYFIDEHAAIFAVARMAKELLAPAFVLLCV